MSWVTVTRRANTCYFSLCSVRNPPGASRHRAERDVGWGEFVSGCAGFDAEIASAVAKEKLGLAELDEVRIPPPRLGSMGTSPWRKCVASVTVGRLAPVA